MLCVPVNWMIAMQVTNTLRALIATLLLSATGTAGAVYPTMPNVINADETYMLYAHGLIAEGDDPRPVHSRWGADDFPAVAAAIAKGDINAIAYHRHKETEPRAYAVRLAQQVRQLLMADVAPNRITMVGFSRGGRIAAYAPRRLKGTPVNTVILAGCGGWIEEEEGVVLSGTAFSMYETSDTPHSCQQLADRSGAKTSFEELAISTGKEHGAFYRPIPEWVEPVIAWIEKQARAEQ